MSKTLNPLLSTGSTQEVWSQHDGKIVDCDIKNQSKQMFLFCLSALHVLSEPFKKFTFSQKIKVSTVSGNQSVYLHAG